MKRIILLCAVALLFNLPASAADLKIGVSTSEAGQVDIFGSTSGDISLIPQAAAGTYNWNWPTTAGTAGQVLTSQGGSSTAMTWTTAGSAAQIMGGGVVASQAANSIKQYALSGISTGQTNTTSNFAIAARGGTFKNLYFSSQNTPAQADSYIITLFTGTAGGTLTATTLTCTVHLTTDTLCNDTTHTVTVTAGQGYVISVNVLTGASALTGSNWGIEFDPT